MILGLKSVVEVVLSDVLDQSGVHRSPSQEFLSLSTRPWHVARRHGAEKRTEVGGCLFTGNADHWQIQVTTDDVSDVAEWHPLVSNSVQS